ncbi:MAG: prolyl oligopeptidase family serine peptidase [Planctomycetaceae bacterium]|jgi:prolyl oligopeptidase|nr:prolyl oligopeptidase family serine peptidase [Planctomycetaceae bacterium]
MKKTIINTLLVIVTVCSFDSAMFAQPFDYPPARKADQKDEFFGTNVADSYRWMEADSPELQNWIEAENKLTHAYLDTIPFRDDLRKRITKLVDYPKYGTPWTRAGHTFYFKNDGLQNQSVLYLLDGKKPQVLLDPNKLSEDGTVALQTTSLSKDGKYLAYSIARSGSDWNEIFVLDIATGKTLSDHLEWVKFSGIAWLGNGFFYSRYDAPTDGDRLTAKNEYHKIYYHALGANQTDDRLLREDQENPLRNMSASTDRDERFLFVSESESTYGHSLYIRGEGESDLTPVITDFRSEQDVVAVLDDSIYLLTDRDAPNKRLVRLDPARPTPEHWIDVIPETDTLLSDVTCIGGRFIVTYLKDAAHEAFVFDKEGHKIRDIKLPTLGITGFSGEKDSDVYYQSFTSYTYPTVIYKCNIESGKREEMFPSEINFSKEDYVTDRVWYTNSDGRKVPIFLSYKKGLKKDGNNPTLLYGYGGFNISVQPSFSAYRIPFLEQGGIYAHAVLRGGGEYGEAWHKSGTKLQKQNVFDDFIAAAEFLIAEKYTSPQKLACQGGSNGGLLVGATILQRPDLFRAALPAVGVLDMLRYHKFTIGWAWATDYGTSEESKEMFEYLLGYSPLHNVKSGVNYPAVLVTTSDHDDRVVPAHSFKFTATMQAKSGGHKPPGERPVYIRIETKAGHGAGKPMTKVIDESTDIWSFLMDQLGMKPAFGTAKELEIESIPSFSFSFGLYR